MFARQDTIAGRIEDEYGTAQLLEPIRAIVPSARVFAASCAETSRRTRPAGAPPRQAGSVGSTQASAISTRLPRRVRTSRRASGKSIRTVRWSRNFFAKAFFVGAVNSPAGATPTTVRACSLAYGFERQPAAE